MTFLKRFALFLLLLVPLGILAYDFGTLIIHNHPEYALRPYPPLAITAVILIALLGISLSAWLTRRIVDPFPRDDFSKQFIVILVGSFTLILVLITFFVFN